MFALLPQSVRRSTPLARFLRAFFIFILTISNLLLPPASVARGDAPRDYFPNQSKHIVNLPGRERVYGADGMCKAEVRTVYSDFDAAVF